MILNKMFSISSVYIDLAINMEFTSHSLLLK